jgi:hypothetical protein
MLSIYIGISGGDNTPARTTIIDIIPAEREKESTLSIKGHDYVLRREHITRSY